MLATVVFGAVALALLFLGVWLLAPASLKRVLGRSPYGHLPRQRLRVIGPDGEPLGDSDEAIAYVSRHGLLERGITCPCCGALAARPGEFDKIAQTSWGEAILCSCLRMLLAAPDDDVDPVKPGVRYDPAVYHRFARPKNLRIRQRTLNRQPRVGDRVVVIDYKMPIKGGEQDLDGTEGQVEDIRMEPTIGTLVTVRLLGTDGMSGMPGNLLPVSIPLAYLRVMALPTLRKGDRVRILRGEGAGNEGDIKCLDMSPSANALVVVATIDGQISTTIERVEKIYPD